MKKKAIIFSIVVILLVSILILKFVPLGTKKEFMGASLISLEIPKLSSIDSECCMYSATFKTLRSSTIIKKELDKIMDKYEKVTCNDQEYYYDHSQDVTITEYGVDSGLILSKFYITYTKGNYCE